MKHEVEVKKGLCAIYEKAATQAMECDPFTMSATTVEKPMLRNTVEGFMIHVLYNGAYKRGGRLGTFGRPHSSSGST